MHMLLDPEIGNQELEKVEQKANELVQRALKIKVVDVATQKTASEYLLAIAAMRKEVQNTFKPMKQAARKLHLTVCEQEEKHAEPLEQAEQMLKAELGSFVREQMRLAREAEEAARKKAMEEAERAAKEEAERLALEDAETLAAAGNMAAAEAVLSNPAPVPIRYVAPAPIAPAVTKVAGISTREDWDFRIVDASLIPREYLTVNESAIRAVGKSTKGNAKIPGVEFFARTIVAARRGA